MHYFRVPREYWRDRLQKIKACGFNTVETYTCWNLHEKTEGKFDFNDMLDLREYLNLIKELGMYAIVRPGPYICSEWDFGGLPWWLLNYDDIEFRCMNSIYLSKVDAYFDKLIPIIADCQISHGGSVIMVQVENEYGSYGDDSEYIRYLADGLRSRGIDCELFTSDGDCDFMLSGGTVPEIFKTVNFGSNAKRNFESLRKYQKSGPLMCMEFWNGWFDHWGDEHHKRNPEESAECFKEIIDLGGSVNVYMMHGGTNFGFMNGANCTESEYQPTVNSYDDDAPINEFGGLTEKYFAFKKVLADAGMVSEINVCQPVTVKYPDIVLNEFCELFEAVNILSNCIKTTVPQNMERLGQGYGYIMYKTFIKGPKEKNILRINIHDRAYLYVDNVFREIIDRNADSMTELSVPPEGVNLSVLVENMGRINYGPFMKDKKGIVEPVRLGNQFIYHWENYPLPLDDISGIEFKKSDSFVFNNKPLFFRGALFIDNEPVDTFVDLSCFTKGVIWVNGFLLSRYWKAGPQKTVYLPAPLLHKGKNEIVLLEFEGFDNNLISFSDYPDLG